MKNTTTDCLKLAKANGSWDDQYGDYVMPNGYRLHKNFMNGELEPLDKQYRDCSVEEFMKECG